jgi:hypothetical protein
VSEIPSSEPPDTFRFRLPYLTTLVTNHYYIRFRILGKEMAGEYDRNMKQITTGSLSVLTVQNHPYDGKATWK